MNIDNFLMDLEDPKGYRSPSDVNMYLRCPKQWEFRYVYGLKLPPSGALVQGSAVHGGAEVGLNHKIETGEDMPMDDVLDAVSTTFDGLAVDAEFGEDNPGELKDQAIDLGRTWRNEVAPKIVPVAVEMEWELTIDDVTYLGYIDVVDAEGRVRDLKTSARKPSADILANHLQAQSYALAISAQAGEIPEVAFDYVVKTKAPYAETRSAQYTERQLEIVAETVLDVTKGIRAGVFPRSTDGWWCSPKFCGYWERCMR